MDRDKKIRRENLLREWYRPTKRGEQARQMLMDEHPDYFGG